MVPKASPQRQQSSPVVLAADGWPSSAMSCVFFGPRSVPRRRFRICHRWKWEDRDILKAGGEETCAMAYCITLRSRTDTRIITGWYAGTSCRWSTDDNRRKVFDNKHDARSVCREL